MPEPGHRLLDGGGLSGTGRGTAGVGRASRGARLGVGPGSTADAVWGGFLVTGLFVPDALSVRRDTERREAGRLYRFLTTHLYAAGFGAVSLGIAAPCWTPSWRWPARKPRR